MSYTAPFYWSKAFWKGILPGSVGLVVGILVAKVYDLQQGQPLQFTPDEAEVVQAALTGLGLALWGTFNNWRKHNPRAAALGLDDFWGLWPCALLCGCLALYGCGTGPDGQLTLLPQVTTVQPDGTTVTRTDTEAVERLLSTAQSQYDFWGREFRAAQERNDARAAAEAQRKQEAADRKMQQLLDALALVRGEPAPEAKLDLSDDAGEADDEALTATVSTIEPGMPRATGEVGDAES